jgi:acyl-CoA thioesterase-1
MNTPMKKILVVVGICILICIVIFMVIRLATKTTITNKSSTGTTIIAFGDSLVYGAGATTPDRSFVSLLSGKINQPIINLGKNGDTTESALTRLDSVLELNPKIVIVLLGGNDFLQSVPPYQTFTNLNTIVTTIQAHGAAVLLLGIRGGLITDPYSQRFEAFAKAHGTAYVPDVLNGLIGNTEYMADAIHPNDKGNQIIANKIAPVLEGMLH